LATLLNEGFAQIEETLVRQRQFTADASHELRTPVSVVLAQTQAALARPRQEAEYRNALEACQRSAQRMRRLVESLLTLARLESGEEPLHLQPTDLNQIAADSTEAVQPLALGAGLVLRFEPSANPVPGRVDPDRLGQVLLNLLGNAVAYNRPGGSITVTTGTSGAEAFVRVSDTGIGIAPEHLPRLFERFYRVDDSRSNPRGHTGLGLAISQQILLQHGGRITVESEPGKGSAFTVWIIRSDA
jgi:signal transduction histidine kinase